jgi:hypothetical protein
MADRNYTAYQQKAIKRFYDNRDQLDEQRLSELVANLYLATGKKREKLWETASDLMTRLHVPASRIQHVMTSQDVSVLAAVVQDLAAGKIVPPPKPTETRSNPGSAPQ